MLKTIWIKFKKYLVKSWNIVKKIYVSNGESKNITKNENKIVKILD